ncbi:MAG: LamG-like jellyroll fold domain-containing protein, partial [Planctomycetota bacterium]
VTTSSGSFTASPRPPNFPGEWGHLCLTYDGSAVILYKDGEEVARIAASGKLQQDDVSLSIGGRLGSGQNFTGIIDDVRLYNRALTPAEIKQIMQGPPAGPASDPSPDVGAQDVPRETILSWTPGEFAPAVNGHIVYLSESFNDVNDGLGGTTHSASNYAPPQRLDFETTYYWRVDEVNAPPDSTVFPGDVWSFTTEPIGYAIENLTATASSTGQADFGPEKTIDGSGLDDNGLHSTAATDMWLSGSEPLGAWIQYELDNVYKLHEMWVWNSNQIFEGLFGFGMKDVTVEYSTDGVDWTALAGVPEFAQAPGTSGYAHNTTVDFGGAVAQYVRLTASSNWGGVLPQYGLCEVRFFYIPVSAREPSPDSGATDAAVDGTFSWRAGREAATHDVSLSTDEQAVIDGTAPVVSVADASYSSPLDLGSTYYWRIDEVNDAETPTTWQGDIWNFSTPEYLVVDGFEDYNDYPPDEIYTTWLDGYENPANGSQVGYLTPPTVETATLHGGDQSMPLLYSNTGGATYSEAERTFAAPQDWTRYGIQTLVLYFHGTVGNTGQLYVKVNGVKVAYPGDATDVQDIRWKQWNIDLASLGVNLASVTKLAIGIDGNGAAGTLYVDDIALYRSAPEVVISSEEIWIEAEAGTITAPMETYDDPAASGGKYISTDESVGDENDTAPADGIATYNFTVQGGVYRISLRVIVIGGSDSFWVRIPTATNQTHEDPDQPGTGWIRFNDISDGANWHWDDVHSNDHDNEVVNLTLPAGQHTLEIVRREDGTQLDVIVISKID